MVWNFINPGMANDTLTFLKLSTLFSSLMTIGDCVLLTSTLFEPALNESDATLDLMFRAPATSATNTLFS